MLPEGWKPYRLGELMSFRNGLNFKQADVGEAIKIVGVGDFQARSTLVDTSELATISVSGSVRETDLLQDGDLLFVRSNGNKALIGRCLYFPSVKERLSFSGFTIRGRIDSTKVLPEFSSYLVRADHVTAQFFQGGSGTNISNLSQEILSDVCVTIPRPLEQERISKLLLTWDKAISATEKLLANSRRQKQALMWGLLSGKRRFVSPAGSWQYVDFDRVFERITRKNSICNDNVLTISGQHGLIGQRDYFNKSVASDNLSGYTLLEWGDFAYNKSYSAGYPMGAIKPLLAYDAGVVSSLYLCFRLRANVDADLDFFRHYFEAGLLNEEISGIAQEGARNHGLLNVSVTDFFKLRLHIPPAPVQRKIAEAINVAEAEERWFEQELIRFQTEKRALMQQLLTGKRRVRLPATEAASV